MKNGFNQTYLTSFLKIEPKKGEDIPGLNSPRYKGLCCSPPRKTAGLSRKAAVWGNIYAAGGAGQGAPAADLRAARDGDRSAGARGPPRMRAHVTSGEGWWRPQGRVLSVSTCAAGHLLQGSTGRGGGGVAGPGGRGSCRGRRRGHSRILGFLTL